MRYDVFISYSSIDQKIAEGVCAYLEQQGIRCFVAYRDIPRGVVWATAIVEALENSRMMVVLFSKNFNNSAQVEREIELASDMKLPILTFRLCNDAFRGAKKYYLQNLNWIDAFPNPERAFCALHRNVASLLGTTVADNHVKQEVQEPRGNKSSNLYLWIVIGCLSVALVVFFYKQTSSEIVTDDYVIDILTDSVENSNLSTFESVLETEKNVEENNEPEIEILSLNEIYKIYDLGKKEYNNKNYSEAFKLLKKCAELGHTDAQNLLGLCYEHGHGVMADLSEAFKWFEKSAEQGSYVAEYNLGRLYENGIGVSQDFIKSFKWYKKSADQGYWGAQYELGRFYSLGIGVSQNSSEAFKWYEKSAEQGYADAQFEVGTCYYWGTNGVSKDLSKALEWFKKASDQGHETAKSSYVSLYIKLNSK